MRWSSALVVAALALTLYSSAPRAQVYRCQGEAGTVFQDTPCEAIRNDTAASPIPMEQRDDCSGLAANRDLQLRCLARQECERRGAYGSTLSKCTREVQRELASAAYKAEWDARQQAEAIRDEARREAERAKAERKWAEYQVAKRDYETALAAQAEARRNRPPEEDTELDQPRGRRQSVNDDAVSCYALDRYAKAQGHGWMERALIVDAAKSRGDCR